MKHFFLCNAFIALFAVNPATAEPTNFICGGIQEEGVSLDYGLKRPDMREMFDGHVSPVPKIIVQVDLDSNKVLDARFPNTGVPSDFHSHLVQDFESILAVINYREPATPDRKVFSIRISRFDLKYSTYQDDAKLATDDQPNAVRRGEVYFTGEGQCLIDHQKF